MKKLVLLLRQNPEDLTAEQRAAIEGALGTEVEFQRMDSKDYLEHYETCRRLKPAIVVLPGERPVPSLAIEQGYTHVKIENGKLLRLTRLQPDFLPFEAET